MAGVVDAGMVGETLETFLGVMAEVRRGWLLVPVIQEVNQSNYLLLQSKRTNGDCFCTSLLYGDESECIQAQYDMKDIMGGYGIYVSAKKTCGWSVVAAGRNGRYCFMEKEEERKDFVWKKP